MNVASGQDDVACGVGSANVASGQDDVACGVGSARVDSRDIRVDALSDRIIP